MAAIAGGRGYALETFPTNVRVMEAAVGALQGRAVPGAVREGTLSAAARRAETIVGASGKMIGVQDIGAAEALWLLGKLQYRAGNYAAGQATFSRLLEIHERVLGPNRAGAGAILNELALTAGHQGHFDESDRLFARAGTAAQSSLDPEEALMLLAYRASVNRDRRPAEALQWSETAVKMAERFPETRRGRPFSLAIHAFVLASNKRFAEGATTASTAIAMFERPGGVDSDWRLWWVGELHALRGSIARDDKRFAEARREYELALERRELLFGEAAPRVIEARVALGRTEQAEGNLDAALKHFRRAAELQLKHRAALEGARLPSVLFYLEALGRAAEERPAERQALAAEILTAMQIPRGTETAKALRAMSARVGSGDPKLAAVTRALQDAERRRTSVRHALIDELAKPADQREARQEDLTRQVREAEEKIEALETQLQAEFPRYARLTAERPLAADEVKALLRADEALVAFLPGNQVTYVALVRRDGVHVHRVRIGRSALETDVKALRESLDLSADGKRVFDVARAQRLHDLLLGPLKAPLAGVRHVLTVPSGPLLSLPLGVLVTKAAPPGADYRTMPFLAVDVAISVLPSVAALRDLRAVAGRSSAPEPFLAFADPAFAGAQQDLRAVGNVANLCRDGAVDAATLRTLPRLPDSADEVRKIAAALGARSDSVVLGAAATEARVRTTDLSRYRVLAFATHGLLPGELQCQAEPALALTPPSVPTADDDGLLDASEVAALKLDADWVVLSACNTAGPDGSLGGESLSGLTRAFFYAGARTLLVSQWTVASGPTVDLTTGIFAVTAKEAGIGKAEALQRSQAALRAKPATAHPFFWAPFVLVGDGGTVR
jgi:CHAT domain-containing protein